MALIKVKYTNTQITFLLLLRFLVGWHILYEGISKLIQPQWSSLSFLKNSTWIMSDLNSWIVTNSTILMVVDFFNVWGLIAIGLGLIFGLFFKPAAISGSVLLLFYYLSAPPLIGLVDAMPTEGNYLIVNKTLI
jgi:thiosulfate dehydrogenase [quinone] large subunit